MRRSECTRCTCVLCWLCRVLERCCCDGLEGLLWITEGELLELSRDERSEWDGDGVSGSE